MRRIIAACISRGCSSDWRRRGNGSRRRFVRELCSFDYAIVRVVPRVDRGEFINAGVVLFCSTKTFLDARIELDRERLLALAPDVDVPLVESHLSVIPIVCR